MGSYLTGIKPNGRRERARVLSVSTEARPILIEKSFFARLFSKNSDRIPDRIRLYRRYRRRALKRGFPIEKLNPVRRRVHRTRLSRRAINFVGAAEDTPTM